MDITQEFYNNLAPHYDKLFQNWQETVENQASILQTIICEHGFSKGANVLDCACGIGTQALGLSSLGFRVTASDISQEALKEAEKRAQERNLNVNFVQADFRALNERFSEKFDIILAMDNALPHMLTEGDLDKALSNIVNQMAPNGIFIASIRDYDQILKTKPNHSAPYIHENANGQKVSFQTWKWNNDRYQLVQYVIEDEETLKINKFCCEYRAVLRQELTVLLKKNGCSSVKWVFPTESGFYQPIVIGRK
ncbi:MAG: class I SAM-dependent methyltransferase [Clostridia bacterium]|nr:class I SAM-dependent methyltransferase [Clostridia bacterium]